jgi:hypothetical protein
LELGSAEIATNFNDFSPTIRVKHAFEKFGPASSDWPRRTLRERMYMWRDFSRTVRALWRIPGEAGGAYRPDLHYMRGPGPKWHARHAGFLATTPPAGKTVRPTLRDIAQRRA